MPREPDRRHRGPARLGTRFRWVLASSWTSNLGDGILIAAGPLLVASRTDDAFLVALAALLQWLPPLLFGLWAGAVTDRLDRRRLVIVVDRVRTVVVAAAGGRSRVDVATISLVLVAMFLLGTAETFADNASSTLVPMLVHRDDLALANSRIKAGFVTVNQLVGPPLGACCSRPGSAAVRRRRRARRRGRAADLPHRAAAAPDGSPRPTSGTTSPRGCAGCGTTPRCGRSCSRSSSST